MPGRQDQLPVGLGQGFINIEQNQVIKLCSIAAAVVLPPTLLTSVYGMSLEHIPAPALSYGYRVALVRAGVAPHAYFKYTK